MRQAEALRRQRIAEMAHAVNIGMASGEDGQRALDELELSKTKEQSLEERSRATWDMLLFIGGGKGV